MIPDGGGHWLSMGFLNFESHRYSCTISIYPGSLNNLASVPWLFRVIINPNGPHRPAAALHDALYYLKGVTAGRVFSREEADLLFLDAMLTSKRDYWNALESSTKSMLIKADPDIQRRFESDNPLTCKFKARLMYKAVSFCGGCYWGK